MRKRPDAVGGVDGVDALDLDAVFADDAGPGRHGVECAGVAGGVFDEEEGDGFAVGRPGGLLHLAGDVGELLDLVRSFGPEEDLLLVGLGFVVGAVGEEGEGRAVGRPDGCVDGAVRAFDVDQLVVGGVGDVGEVKGGAVAAAQRPGNGGAVGRDRDAAGPGGAGELLVGIGCVGRGR